jgi:hypothetical protein
MRQLDLTNQPEHFLNIEGATTPQIFSMAFRTATQPAPDPGPD